MDEMDEMVENYFDKMADIEGYRWNTKFVDVIFGALRDDIAKYIIRNDRDYEGLQIVINFAALAFNAGSAEPAYTIEPRGPRSFAPAIPDEDISF